MKISKNHIFCYTLLFFCCCTMSLKAQIRPAWWLEDPLNLAAAGLLTYEAGSLENATEDLIDEVKDYSDLRLRNAMNYGGAILDQVISDEITTLNNRLIEIEGHVGLLQPKRYYSSRDKLAIRVNDVREALTVAAGELGITVTTSTVFNMPVEVTLYGEKLNLLQNFMTTATRLDRLMDDFQDEIDADNSKFRILSVLRRNPLVNNKITWTYN